MLMSYLTKDINWDVIPPPILFPIFGYQPTVIMEYLREHIDRIIAECDIVFIQWLIDNLPDTEKEIRDTLISALESKIVCN